MRYETLCGLGARAAIVGGALRIVSSYMPYKEGLIWQEFLYSLTDICLLFGLLAIYLAVANELGRVGLTGFVLAAVGLASIVGPDIYRWGVDFYQVGAALLLVGLAVLSLKMLRAEILKPSAIVWLSAFIAAAAALPLESDSLSLTAGILFGAGFLLAGSELLSYAQRPYSGFSRRGRENRGAWG